MKRYLEPHTIDRLCTAAASYVRLRPGIGVSALLNHLLPCGVFRYTHRLDRSAPRTIRTGRAEQLLKALLDRQIISIVPKGGLFAEDRAFPFGELPVERKKRPAANTLKVYYDASLKTWNQQEFEAGRETLRQEQFEAFDQEFKGKDKDMAKQIHGGESVAPLQWLAAQLQAAVEEQRRLEGRLADIRKEAEVIQRLIDRHTPDDWQAGPAANGKCEVAA